jgi:hypothetical protein
LKSRRLVVARWELVVPNVEQYFESLVLVVVSSPVVSPSFRLLLVGFSRPFLASIALLAVELPPFLFVVEHSHFWMEAHA